ncbi:MAG: hypothetical protein LBT70_04115, partial [Holosporaceae bacterium]|nr:hypothetical protein [Holosporaceae bacterium]
MKKLAIATAAILYCFASFGMENNLPVQDEFDTYVRGWAKELAAPLSEREDRDLNEFSTVPFKKKLLDEIGNDSLAQEEFKLFHTHDFVGLWKHWGESRDRMLPNNAEKFRDLLILSAPIINAEKSKEPYV